MRETGLRGSLIAERKRCGKGNCRCHRDGEVHGPYYYRRWRDSSGRQRKKYVPRRRVGAVQAALRKARANSPRELMRMLRELEALAREKSKAARRRLTGELGRYWHGRCLRERRSFPAEQRDRALYGMNREQIVTAVGWEITEDDFVTIQGMIRSERKRRNRLRLPWTATDPATGETWLRVALDLWVLPSYRQHVKRQTANTELR